ncbi:hypothetical protein ELQ21_10860 [Neisseria meningitidis]|nr:hypothetical protein [Neisseria meningitidis]MBG8590336.1 hypothetical protein [Neisseria meningitidis]MBG8650038.1 hypothetical protein [Neisseria meningitidis]MBG8654453.1 hypothetical protein [Neisseria meningitidis]MBG8670014.1 hypothetical protein [Neisseria meningitidis]
MARRSFPECRTDRKIPSETANGLQTAFLPYTPYFAINGTSTCLGEIVNILPLLNGSTIR